MIPRIPRSGLDEEQDAMSTLIHEVASPLKNSRRSHRSDRPSTRDDSVHSPYLRRWIALSAARHRELLLNIDAASRIGLAPVVVRH
jgi:hypothetical protein